MILLSSLSKYRLWQSQPLVGQFRLLAEAPEYLDAKCDVRDGLVVTHDRPAVLLTSVEDGSQIQGQFLNENLPPGVIALETTNLAQGAYEVLVAIGREQTWLAETVWVLEQSVYAEILRREGSERFERLPSIASNDELLKVVNTSIRSVWPRSDAFTVRTVSFSSSIPVPASAVDWTARSIFETLQYVTPFGLTYPVGDVVIQNDHFELIVEAKLGQIYPSLTCEFSVAFVHG